MSDAWNQANCKKSPPCEPLEAFIPPKVETHKCVLTHAEKSILCSVWSTLEQIICGYFAHWGILALLQLATQAQSCSCGMEVALLLPLLVVCLASPCSAPYHYNPCNPIEPGFLYKSKQNHSWAWDTVQTTTVVRSQGPQRREMLRRGIYC